MYHIYKYIYIYIWKKFLPLRVVRFRVRIPRGGWHYMNFKVLSNPKFSPWKCSCCAHFLAILGAARGSASSSARQIHPQSCALIISCSSSSSQGQHFTPQSISPSLQDFPSGNNLLFVMLGHLFNETGQALSWCFSPETDGKESPWSGVGRHSKALNLWLWSWPAFHTTHHWQNVHFFIQSNFQDFFGVQLAITTHCGELFPQPDFISPVYAPISLEFVVIWFSPFFCCIKTVLY